MSEPNSMYTGATQNKKAHTAWPVNSLLCHFSISDNVRQLVCNLDRAGTSWLAASVQVAC